MSWPRKVMRPALGSSAPAMHFSSVLLPEPFGPIRPWSCPSSTTKSTSPSAASCPNIFVTPRASSSAIGRLARDVAWTPDGDAERAGARPLVQHQRSEEHTSELQSQSNLVCRLLLEEKMKISRAHRHT